MAIFTDTKVPYGSEFTTNATDSTAWTRREPLITPDQLTVRHLFGIPMYSAIPDPVTQQRSHLTNENLKDIIIRAASRIELEVGITITPVTRYHRAAFDRVAYLNMGYFELPDRPILRVLKVVVETANGDTVYSVPLEWVDLGQAHFGQLNIVPMQPAFLNAGFIPSQSAGGAAFLSILGAKSWIPSYWSIEYITGYDETGVPLPVNDLIGLEAAIEVLGLLGATNRVGSHSLGIDAMSQSVSTPGPQVYQFRIEQLTQQKKELVGRIKARHKLKLFSGNV